MKRRGRGEGSVFFRQDLDLWCGMLTTGYDGNGKRRRRAVYGATKAEVLEKMVRLRHGALTGQLGEPSRLTLSQFLGHWLNTTGKASLRASTAALYESSSRIHIAPRLGGIALSRVTPAHIQGLLDTMGASGISLPVRQVAFRLLHRSLRQAVEWNMVPRNPADAVARPRLVHPEMRALTSDEVRRFLEAARAERLFALYSVLLGTGLRLGEALGLTWPAVDLAHGRLEVRQQLCELSGKLWMQAPKTKTSLRTLDLPSFVVGALREHEARARVEGTLLNDRLLVFTDTAGHPLRRSNVRLRSFAPLLKTAQVSRCRLHDLRHTCATLALKAGVPPHVVSKMLGHARVSITMDVYAHCLPGQGKEAARVMDAVFTTADST